MPPDLPASLVAEILDWVACDECGGTGSGVWAVQGGPHGIGSIGKCPRPHTVVTYEGRRIHADPGRMETVCNWHRHPGEGCNGEWPRCRLVLRPEIPLDLEEA